MPFDAATSVEPMDFNFSTFAVDEQGKPLPGAVGVVPEPSQEEYRVYVRGLVRVQGEYKKIEKVFENDKSTEKELEAAGKKTEELSKKIDKLVSVLCHNVPAEEIVAMLPFRVKNAFSKWLQSEFSPKD